ncbi:putative AP complex subunit beta, AP-3 complex subunit beta domain-containing protein [Rosa chinensis]|uniref:AP-3 complex subunit beta n=1 Tax=Rosa chinensis TaxID=74649 RepID=A0A2P6SKM1_ROSCH|nr:AP3-complex subunit beta-A [Rosa chinensis]PRQ59216.1 putative AP complex subunit beta, AP-3 complex subunit beta domain-containing protein [Rosa chinensis]
MFPQFGATADTLSKASTMVFRIGTDAHLYDDPEDVSIAPLLDSKFDSEKCEALKRLLALIAQGFDVSNFFPQVVKNVATQSLEVKKLVYLYLLHYAQKRPNEALLSINCFQKDLGDPNPLVRAWALRAMAGIRLHVIAPLVVVAVGKCARDPSVYVRKCAANALPKLNDLRLDEYTAGIEEIIGILLNDNSPCVVGAAAAAFSSICPTNLSLIGRNYRRLCEILPDIEEWGQIVLIGILLRYVIARHGFVQESIMASLHHTENSKSQNDFCDTNSVLEDSSDMSGLHESELANAVFRCYIEGPDEYLSRVGFMNKDFSEFNPHFTSGNNNEDVKFLLRCTSPLLWSNNSAVVLAAAGVHWIMSPMEEVKRIVKPLLFVQRSSTASKYVVLCNIQLFAKAIPSLFSPYFEDFFICSSDSYQIKALKLDILAHIATDSSIPFVLKEFQDYIRDPDRRFAADTVAAIGICAQRLPKMANTCLEFLLALTRQQVMTGEFGSVEGEANILIQAIMSIKSIVQRDPPSHEKVIIQLVRSLNSVKVPAARAIIVWMVGEYNSLGDIIPRMLTTVLKYLARCFTSEELETKLQICNTTVKVLLRAEGNDRSTIQKVLSYVLELAKCDLSYDVRDRAYFLKNLLSSYLDSQGLKEENIILSQNKDIPCVLAKYLFGGKTKSNSSEPIDHRFYLPGSLSQIVLHAAPGYEPLPKPCTMLSDGLEINGFGEGVTNSDTYVTDDQNSVSESLDEENSSSYSSQHSNGSGSEGDGSASEDDDNSNPLIQLTDVGNAHEVKNGASQSASDFGELLSNRALESWLDEQPGFSSSHNPEQSQVHRSSARISIGDFGGQVKPKIYALLDPVNGNGLKVDYSFSSEISDISPLFICIEVSFKNCSNEIMCDIYLVDEESDKGTDSGDQTSVTHESSMISQNNASNLASVEEIASLESGQTVTRIIQVRFHHHLLPLKLTLYCNGKKLPVKLRPDIGYFVRALPLDVDAFTIKESHLRGMFECTRRCNFIDHIEDLDKNKGDKSLVEDKFLVICRSLALKMLSNANLYLVSVDMPVAAKLDDATGLCLRFSSKLLSTSVPCLITITVEGRCSEPLELTVKVNCEETVFGLNLLNRIVNFLG